MEGIMRGAGRMIAVATVAAACLWSTSAYAQHGHHGGVGHYSGHGYYGGGHRYGLGFSFGYGHGGYYGPYGHGPYFYGSYYYPPYSYYDGAGAVRLRIEPAQARVFVDGYYAGVVDDFDGRFQRLRLAPGRHEITLKLDGYRTYRVRVYAPPDRTVAVHHEMTAGDAEDEFEDLVGGAQHRSHGDTVPGEWRREARESGDGALEDDHFVQEAPHTSRGAAGELRMIVHPADASVYVDGEFRGSGREARRLGLAAGPHRVEVVRPGFAPVDRQVEIEAGRRLDLHVELPPS